MVTTAEPTVWRGALTEAQCRATLAAEVQRLGRQLTAGEARAALDRAVEAERTVRGGTGR